MLLKRLFSGKEIPEEWSKKLDFRLLIKDLIDKDEDFAKYVKDNDSFHKKKYFRNLAMNIDNMLTKSQSLKKIELCRPLSGIKQLLETKTVRKESPDSTFCDVENINDKSINKKDKIYHTERNISVKNRFTIFNTPKNSIELPIMTYSSLTKKESNKNLSLQQISRKESINNNPFRDSNIHVIAEEENNEFLITGMKFNENTFDNKRLSNFFHDRQIEKEKFENRNTKDKLPPLLKKSTIILNSKNSQLSIKRLGNDEVSTIDFSKTNKKSLRNSNLIGEIPNLICSQNLPMTSTHANLEEVDNNYQNLPTMNKNRFLEKKDTPIINKEKSHYYNIEEENKKLLKNSKLHLPKRQLNTHTIIDYSFNKSDFVISDYKKYQQFKDLNSNINYSNTGIKNHDENFNTINNSNSKKKLDIKNEKIKILLEKSKQKGSYAPYFSLCNNCNERNNDFFNNIDAKNALGIIKIISKDDDKKPFKFEKL